MLTDYISKTQNKMMINYPDIAVNICLHQENNLDLPVCPRIPILPPDSEQIPPGLSHLAVPCHTTLAAILGNTSPNTSQHLLCIGCTFPVYKIQA